MDELERFTCVLYGNSRTKKVNQLRFTTLQIRCGGKKQITESKKFDLATLPPCKSILEQHVLCCNFQTRIWKLAHIAKPFVPNAIEGHGWTLNTGIMQPKWIDGEVVPRKLVDILEKTIEGELDNSDSDTDSDNELSESDLIEEIRPDNDTDSDSDA